MVWSAYVSVCVCVCFAQPWLTSCLQFESYIWTSTLSLHSALCSHVCMRQKSMWSASGAFTKDVRNVVVWNFMSKVCVRVCEEIVCLLNARVCEQLKYDVLKWCDLLACSGSLLLLFSFCYSGPGFNSSNNYCFLSESNKSSRRHC